MKKKQDGIKYNTIPKGKIIIVLFWVIATIVFLMGIIMLPMTEGIGVMLAGVFLYGMLAMFYWQKYSNILVFTDEKITLKKLSISWDDVYITSYCPGPSQRNNYDIYIYFADHYLTIQEVCSRAVKRKGFYIILNYERTKYILSKYSKKVAALNFARVDRAGIMAMINAHNAVFP